MYLLLRFNLRLGENTFTVFILLNFCNLIFVSIRYVFQKVFDEMVTNSNIQVTSKSLQDIRLA
jgi:hypothetical protein